MNNRINTLFSRGSEWRKWDLHVHSPASYGGNYEIFVENINHSEADVIGINDYCTIEGYYQVRFKSNTKLQKPIFPVVEFRMNNIVLDKSDLRLKKGARINFHIIFDNDEKLISRIKTWLNSLNCIYEGGIQEKIGNINVSDDRLKITFDYLKVIQSLESDEQLRDRYLAWLPYDEYGGIDNIDPGNDGYFKLGLINKAHIIGSANKKQIDFFLWKSSKHNTDDIKKWLNCRQLPCIKGSDAKRIDYPFGRLQDQDSQPIEKYCWIKAETTFEGLKQILYEPEDRVYIGDKDPCLFSQAIVNSFSATGGNKAFFLKNIGTCHFNPSLSCIIGSRGSGKSAFLDAMALSLGDQHVLEKARTNYIGYYFINHDASILRSTVKHSASGDEEIITSENSRRSGFLFDYYHQRHIGFLADPNNEEILSRFIFDKIFQDDMESSTIFESLKEERASCISELAVNRQKVVACEREILKEHDVTNKITDKKNRVKFLSKKAINELLNERSKIIKLRERMNRIISRLEIVDDDPIVRDSDLVDTEFFQQLVLSDLDPEWSILPGKWANLEQNAKDILKSLGSGKKSLEDKVDKLTETVIQLESAIDFNEQLNLIMKKIEAQAAKEKIIIARSDLDKLDSIQKEIVGLEDQLKLIQLKKREKKTLLDERQRLLNSYNNYLNSVKEKLETSFQRLLKGDGSVLKGTIQLEISTVLSFHDYLSFVQEQANHDSEDDVPNFPYRKPLLELFTELGQVKIIEAFRKADFDDWNVPGLGARSLDYFRRIQNKEEIAMYLEEILPELTSSLLWRPDSSKEFKYLKNCSIGERGTALLSVILIAGREPLVIDQPEDDLDHYYLYQSLTPIIKHVKKRRQLIFATHDANIVINGDAELIILVSARDGAFGSITPTTIENSETRESMLEILEGGRDAFRRRQRKYGETAT